MLLYYAKMRLRYVLRRMLLLDLIVALALLVLVATPNPRFVDCVVAMIFSMFLSPLLWCIYRCARFLF